MRRRKGGRERESDPRGVCESKLRGEGFRLLLLLSSEPSPLGFQRLDLSKVDGLVPKVDKVRLLFANQSCSIGLQNLDLANFDGRVPPNFNTSES